MRKTHIQQLRLINQGLVQPKLKSAKDVVAGLGAVQAQDINMSKWALGLRMKQAVEADIDAAINAGNILRTHVLRPTWHYVSPEDICWMLALSAKNIKTAVRSREKQLELTDALIRKSQSILEKELEGNHHMARQELIAKFVEAGINVDDNRAAHLFMHAEINGIICSGQLKGSKHTFALLAERVKHARQLNREEALAELTSRYFTSHGPATLDDFKWWSGLSATDCRSALEMVKSQFESANIDERTYWFKPSVLENAIGSQVFAIPAYDEFLISYKDRSASITSEHHKSAVSINGLFRPVIVSRGKVIGIWNRKFNGDTVSFETEYFKAPSKATEKKAVKALEAYASFTGKKSF